MKLSDFQTYSDSPFNVSGIVPVHYIEAGKSSQVVNVNTGELGIYSELGTEKSFNSDKLQFTKVFNGSFSDIKTFSPAALKVWCYIIENLQIRRDFIKVSIKECMEYCEYDSRMPIYNGICELIAKEFIARKVGSNEYFINPNKFFNGKRI
jgi:hypothetical protein